MAEKSSALHIASHFDDFEQFSVMLQNWGLEFCQLDCGRFTAGIHQIRTPDVLLTNAFLNRKMTQQGDYLVKMRAFGLMAKNSSPLTWRNQQLTENSLFIGPKGAGMDVTSLPGFHIYSCAVSERVLSEKLQQYEGRPALEKALQHGGLMEGAPEDIQALRCFLKQLFLEVEKNPSQINSEPFQMNLCHELTHHLFEIMSTSEEKNVPLPLRKHTQLIKKIEPWLRDANDEMYSVHDLCETFQVNARTLRRIFLERYGVPPKQYLLALQLNKVRNDLYQGTLSKVKVVEIANRWGFWHMGNFATIYRRQFGELPSETLNNRRACQG